MPHHYPELLCNSIFKNIARPGIALLFFIPQFAQAQHSETAFLRQVDSIVKLNHLHNRSLHSPAAPFKQSSKARKPLKAGFNIPSFNKPLGLGNCQDTSSRVAVGKDSVHFYVGVSAKTKDGNLLLSGEYVNHYDSFSISKGFLMKCDPYGNVIWTKMYDSLNHQAYHYMVYYYVIELMDGSILMAGLAPDANTTNDDMILTRTDASGNIIWTRDYYSRNWTTGNGSADYFNMIQVKQDVANGDVYISSPAWAQGVYLIKVNISNGDIPWSNMYRLNTNGYGFQQPGGVAIRPNDLVAFSTISAYNTQIVMYRIDKATGDTFSTKILNLLDTPYYKKGFANFHSIQQWPNGNISLSGPLYGYYQYMYVGADPLYQAGVVEVNSNLDFVKCYVFRNNIENNYNNTRITLHPDGSGLFNMLKVKSGYVSDQYFLQFKDGVILKERKRQAVGEGYPSENPALQLPDGGELLIQLVGDSVSNNSRVIFTKLHLTDTSSDCLGQQINNSIVENVLYGDPYQAFTDSTLHFVMQERRIRTITATSLVLPAPQPACYQVAKCDTLVLKAVADTICPLVPFFITARKNRACGSKVQFTYDTAAVQSFTAVNDSTYQVIFRGPWQGYITGSLAGCTLYTDSVPVTVLLAPPVLNLGPDTVLCPGNQLLLNAHSGYATYRWQNGSTDSTFLVTAPGEYYVTTTNACGDSFSDTITAASHPPIPLDLGPNRDICERETLTITAPADFIHYQWAGENIADDTLPSITALPTASNWYKVTAEKTPGCFASDSLYVTVKQTLAIQLGNDTSFCAGQQMILNAGPGFNSYTWSTGQQQQQITVNQPGSYTVEATLNGCSAYDTLQVLNVYPLPVFTLGRDTSLCQGRTLLLNVNLPQATYQWSDQSTTNALTVTQPGNYWLRVTQQGCSTSDTIAVNYTTAPTVQLGIDATLCEGETLLLNAASPGASYTWQDGSTAATYLVNTAGTYYVKASIGQCSNADTILISYIPVPLFTLGRDTFICTGQQLILSPTLNTPAQLLWQDGSTAPSFTVTQEGLYTLQAINKCGSYADAVTIAAGLCNIEMASAFSPNGDGINEVFKVKYPFPVRQFSMIIYNRFGEKVFETTDINQGWDGKWKGKPQLQNSYIWTINFKGINNRQQALKGTVTLIR